MKAALAALAVSRRRIPPLPPSLLLSLSSSLDGSLSLFLSEISLAGPAWKTRAGLQPLAVTSSVQWPPPPPPPSVLWMRRVLSGAGGAAAILSSCIGLQPWSVSAANPVNLLMHWVCWGTPCVYSCVLRMCAAYRMNQMDTMVTQLA